MPEVTPEQLEALATGIGDLTTEVQRLNAAYQSKKAEIDAAVQESRDAVTAEAGRIDDFIQDGEENWSYLNQHLNPRLHGTKEDGDVTLGYWNPGGHTVTWEVIQPEDGVMAQEIGRRMGGWKLDGDGLEMIQEDQRKDGDYLKVASPQFIRMTISRNTGASPGGTTADSYFNEGQLLISRIPGMPYNMTSGVVTGMLGYFAVESGSCRVLTSESWRYAAAGEILENVYRHRFFSQRAGAFDASYWDYFNVQLKDDNGDLVDDVSIIMALPILVQGKCSHFRLVTQPSGQRLNYALEEAAIKRPFAVI